MLEKNKMLERKVVHAKIVGTIFGAGVKIEGEKGILLSSHTKGQYTLD